MALNLGFDGEDGAGSFLPFVKFDSRSGRLFRRDKPQGGEAVDIDISRTFKAVIDFENIETGWIDFMTGSAPVYAVVPIGMPRPPKPTETAKVGVRMVVKLSKECGGDIRELSSNARAFGRGVDDLHNSYLAGLRDNAGKLPVVVLKDTVAVTTGEGAKKSTNYAPVFEIVGWTERPKDLVPSLRGVTAPAAAPAAEAPRHVASPASTGSNRVSAPVAASEDDFG